MNEYIKKYKNEIIKRTQELINIPSFYNEPNNKMPFGKSVNEALEYMLNLGESLGFKTKNIDGYCGYIEFGSGKLFGIVGHLDVVPASNDDWTYPPFNSKIVDNKIYGRGAIDDKGPVIAVLYAMKYVMDNCNIKKRIRLILGLNEERDWKCIEYYKKHEEIPSFGFTPDSYFPCIYSEKRVYSIELSSIYNNKNIILENINCNNNAINVVPKYCSIVLKINNIKIDEIINFINSLIKKYKYNIKIKKINNLKLELISYGKEAHASSPEMGDNAISKVLIILNNILNKYNSNNSLLNFFSKYINTKYYLNLNNKNNSKDNIITNNVGNITLEKNNLKLKLNLRIPNNIPYKEIDETFKNILKEYKNINYKVIENKDGLFIDKDSKFIKTLCNVFNNETKGNYKPIISGGATYARSFKNFVAYGANLPKNIDMSHKTDEYISIDNLLLALRVYSKAIYELTKEK